MAIRTQVAIITCSHSCDRELGQLTCQGLRQSRRMGKAPTHAPSIAAMQPKYTPLSLPRLNLHIHTLKKTLALEVPKILKERWHFSATTPYHTGSV